MKPRNACVHCGNNLHADDKHNVLYPLSQERAHIECVSQPSFGETDAMLVKAKEEIHL